MFMALIFSILTTLNVQASSSCECPEVSCNPCENQINLDFYTSKCGENMSEVMSCAKPICELKDPLPKSCESFAKQKSQSERVPASIPKDVQKKVLAVDDDVTHSEHEIAKVLGYIGKVTVRDTLNREQAMTPNMLLYEGDTIITHKNAKASIRFKDNNEAIIAENSRFRLTTYKAQTDQQKGNAILDLLKGKVRSKVKQKYKEGDKNTGYKVKTQSAVAGVRGTDFIVSYITGKKLVTTVETLTGKVELSDSAGEEKRIVTGEHKSSYVVESKSVFDKKEINEFVKKGYMTPLYKLSKQQVQQLEWETSMSAKRATASVDTSKANNKTSDYVCEKPQAELNQCYWQCVGNPRGEGRCRIDLPQVKCVRKRCNANGEWADPSRVPASQISNCPATGITVKDCDY
ncbi:MAG: FecR family protein [Bdellovibrionales bacterium]|nr:FecR family protein [Bdellovibrionales bacterium]